MSSLLGRQTAGDIRYKPSSKLPLDSSTYQRIISNNSYAHDEHVVNPGQGRGFDGVLYKL